MMAGESQQTPTSEPDPSVLTTDQLLRVVRAERDFTLSQISILKQRMDDRDEATKVLHETVTRMPTDVQMAIGHLKELMHEMFHSVATQFTERDERALRESRDNKVAVDAAFAAQKEAAAEQNKSNTLAIDKSEKATNESINKLGDAAAAANRSLSDKIEDVKSLVAAVSLQVNGIEKSRSGGQEQRTENRAASGAIYAAIGFAVSLLLAAIVVIPLLAK